MRQGSKLAMALVAAMLAAACTTSGPYGPGDGYSYAGSDWSAPRSPYDGPLEGPGLSILDPWLLETEEGRAVVTLGFRDAGRGFVSEDVAHRANIWFRQYADHDRDMRVTDAEIRVALVQAAGRYLD